MVKYYYHIVQAYYTVIARVNSEHQNCFKGNNKAMER